MKDVGCQQPNPFDAYALELAARLRDESPGSTTITALCLGGDSGEAVLRKAIAVAADRAVLAFGPPAEAADHTGVSIQLARAVAAAGFFDLILCGRQAPPEDSGQTGPLLAERLGLPQATDVTALGSVSDGVCVRRETSVGTEELILPTPCLLTVTKPVWDVRLPTVSRSVAAAGAEIIRISLPPPDAAPVLRVRSRKSAPYRAGAVRIQEKTDAASAQILFQMLRTTGVI